MRRSGSSPRDPAAPARSTTPIDLPAMLDPACHDGRARRHSDAPAPSRDVDFDELGVHLDGDASHATGYRHADKSRPVICASLSLLSANSSPQATFRRRCQSALLRRLPRRRHNRASTAAQNVRRRLADRRRPAGQQRLQVVSPAQQHPVNRHADDPDAGVLALRHGETVRRDPEKPRQGRQHLRPDSCECPRTEAQAVDLDRTSRTSARGTRA